MSKDSMIERVARAIHAADTPVCPPWEYSDQEGYRRWARAAIAAMREPTKKMLYAASDMDSRDECGNGEDHWKAMIDAALEESET